MTKKIFAMSNLIAGIVGVGANDDTFSQINSHESIGLMRISPHVLLLCDNNCQSELEEFVCDHELSVFLIKGRPFNNSDQLLRPHFEDKSWDINSTLDGRYLIVELAKNHVNIRTDRINSLPIYYYLFKNKVYFASELLLLTLMVPCNFLPNYEAIAEYAVGGIQTSKKTIFSNVYRSTGGEKLCFSTQENDSIPSITATKINPLSSLLNSNVDNFDNDFLLNSIDRCVSRENYDGSSLLTLTSGRDSFAIALAKGAPTASTTFGDYQSNDRVRGTHRSKRLGHKIVSTSLPNWKYGDFGDFIAIRHGGPPGFQAAHLLYGFSEMPSQYRLAVTGFIGDSISRGLYGDLDEPLENKFYRWFCARHGDLKRVGIHDEEVKNVVARVRESANSLCKDVDPVYAFEMLNLEWRQGAFIATTFDVCDTIVPISTPLFADCFLLYALNAPIDLLLKRRGFSKTMEKLKRRSGINEPKWLSILYSLEQKIKSIKSGRPELNQVDFGLVGKRSENIDIEQLLCGYPKIDNYVLLLWEDRASREPLGFPTFTWLASISLALRLAGDKTILDRRLLKRTNHTGLPV